MKWLKLSGQILILAIVLSGCKGLEERSMEIKKYTYDESKKSPTTQTFCLGRFEVDIDLNNWELRNKTYYWSGFEITERLDIKSEYLGAYVERRRNAIMAKAIPETKDIPQGNMILEKHKKGQKHLFYYYANSPHFEGLGHPIGLGIEIYATHNGKVYFIQGKGISSHIEHSKLRAELAYDNLKPAKSRLGNNHTGFCFGEMVIDAWPPEKSEETTSLLFGIKNNVDIDKRLLIRTRPKPHTKEYLSQTYANIFSPSSLFPSDVNGLLGLQVDSSDILGFDLADWGDENNQKPHLEMRLAMPYQGSKMPSDAYRFNDKKNMSELWKAVLNTFRLRNPDRTKEYKSEKDL